jgi:4-hydroxy-tetrahydrodipicolinate reductase
VTRLAIIGAAGRMGKRLIALGLADEEIELVGAVDAPACPVIGQDAGTVAGVAACGVCISSDVAAAAQSANAIIDFSAAEFAVANARVAAQHGCGFVLGTTGLPDADRAALDALAAAGARIVFAPNMSVGVNVLFQLAGQVARTLGAAYDIEIVEMHHNQKKDAPSGTAERLGEICAQARNLDYATQTAHGREGMVGARPRDEIGMHTLRGGDVVGEHTVIFATQGERIELTHRAGSRDTFAMGAIRAAKYLVTAPEGMHSMADVLGLPPPTSPTPPTA